MVLEAFAAISLAGNILEFVDFGLKLLDWSKEIYQSPGGTSTLETNLHKNTTSLKRCIHEMELEIPESQEPGQSWEERELHSLAAGCKQTADKLLAILEKLRKIGGRSKWQSLYHAARMSMWKAEVEELRNILSEYRSQVGLCILTILKSVLPWLAEDMLISTSKEQAI
jgi:hypothetical protein